MVCQPAWSQPRKSVKTSDIALFWNAFDQVQKTSDTLKQLEIVRNEFIQKGSPGLKAIMQARRYTPEEYLKVMKAYPRFWKSIRRNTLKADQFARDIEQGVEKLRAIYPSLRPAAIYFTVGAFRTGGTTLNDQVLIGSEIAMADSSIPTQEFGQNLSHLSPYFHTNPIRELVFLNVHEFVHTQQKSSIGQSLLAQTVLEGAAEFVATLALGRPSPNPPISYGKTHHEAIREAFEREMFSTNFDNWLWNNTENAFHMRDLGYYVGYAICENFYLRMGKTNEAIRQIIELDCNNQDSLLAFVDKSRYFSHPVLVLKEAFEKARPVLTRIEPFINGQGDVDPGTKRVILYFSEPMDPATADFEIGPLGNNHVMWLEKRIGFSDDRMSYSFEIKPLVSGKRYQLLVTDAFRNARGFPIKPYLIDIRTREP